MAPSRPPPSNLPPCIRRPPPPSASAAASAASVSQAQPIHHLAAIPSHPHLNPPSPHLILPQPRKESTHGQKTHERTHSIKCHPPHPARLSLNPHEPPLHRACLPPLQHHPSPCPCPCPRMSPSPEPPTPHPPCRVPGRPQPAGHARRGGGGARVSCDLAGWLACLACLCTYISPGGATPSRPLGASVLRSERRTAPPPSLYLAHLL